MAATSKRPVEVMIDTLIFLAVFGVMMGAGTIAGLCMLLCGLPGVAALMLLMLFGVLGVIAGCSAAFPHAEWRMPLAVRALGAWRPRFHRRSVAGPSLGWGSYGTRVARNIASRSFRFLG